MTKPTFKIENAKTKFFANKDEYLQFRKSWKDYVNSGSHGDSIHYLIYAALRGKDICEGFTEVTNKNKLQCNGYHKYQGMVTAFNSFCTAMRSYQMLNGKANKTSWEMGYITRYEEMALPFGIKMDKLLMLYKEFEGCTIDSDGNIQRKVSVTA